MTVTDVKAEDVYLFWPKVKGFLEGALSYSLGEYTIKDILKELQEERMTLWVVYEGNDVKACAVCELRVYPQKSFIYMILLGGKGIDEWDEMLFEAIADWAKQNKAFHLAGYCRKGFQRKLKKYGFHPVYTVLTLALPHEDLH